MQWHPYFKAGENDIDNLVLTIDAEEIVQVDDSLIPYEGKRHTPISKISRSGFQIKSRREKENYR